MDWFTVVAQLVNFIILVGLLAYFLYRPIVKAMDERQARIAQQLDEAAERESQAQHATETFEAKSRELDAEREAILAEARDEARRQQLQLTQAARTEVERQRERWQTALAEEKTSLTRGLRLQAAEGAVQLSRQALSELANQSPGEASVDVFLARLADMDDQTRDRMTTAITTAGRSVRVTFAGPLNAATRGRIERALADAFGGKLAIEYDTSAELVLGIQLTAGGHAIGWNADRFLDDFEEKIRETLET